MINECGNDGGVVISRVNPSTARRNSHPVSLCQSRIPHDLGSNPETNRLNRGTALACRTHADWVMSGSDVFIMDTAVPRVLFEITASGFRLLPSVLCRRVGSRIAGIGSVTAVLSRVCVWKGVIHFPVQCFDLAFIFTPLPVYPRGKSHR
jgi:hypothetical protein